MYKKSIVRGLVRNMQTAFFYFAVFILPNFGVTIVRQFEDLSFLRKYALFSYDFSIHFMFSLAYLVPIVLLMVWKLIVAKYYNAIGVIILIGFTVLFQTVILLEVFKMPFAIIICGVLFGVLCSVMAAFRRYMDELNHKFLKQERAKELDEMCDYYRIKRLELKKAEGISEPEKEDRLLQLQAEENAMRKFIECAEGDLSRTLQYEKKG